MLLTDHEWLRFMSFAIVVGGGLGASYTSALLAGGRGLVGATVGGVLAAGVLAVLTHLLARYLLRRAMDPTDGTDGDTDADTTTEANA